MGKQREYQKKPTAPTRSQSTKTSVKSPVHPVEELQGAIGNREMGKYIQSQSNHRSSPLAHELTLPSKITPIQAKPQFGGLSSELIAASSRLTIQPKLTIGEPDDQYEQEADRVAAEVVNRINTPSTQPSSQDQPIQRKADTEEDDELQMKPMLQHHADRGGMAASSDLEASIQRLRGSGQPLDDSIRLPMEQAFGADFSQVRVHADAQSERLNRSISAQAFTTKNDIFFRQGAYQPTNKEGQELIAHELTHVVQQDKQDIRQIKTQKLDNLPKKNIYLKTNSTSTLSAQNTQNTIDKYDKTIQNYSYSESEKLHKNSYLTAHELTHTIQQSGGVRLQPKVVNTIQKQSEKLPNISKVSAIEPSVQRFGDNDILEEQEDLWKSAETKFISGERVAGSWHTNIPEIPNKFIKKSSIWNPIKTKTEKMDNLISEYNQTPTLDTKTRKNKLAELWKVLRDWNWKDHNHTVTSEEKKYFNISGGLLVSQINEANDEVDFLDSFKERNIVQVESVNQMIKNKNFKDWLKTKGYIVKVTGSFERWLQSTSIKKALDLYNKFGSNKKTEETGPYYELNQKLQEKNSKLTMLWKLAKDSSRLEEGLEFYKMPNNINEEYEDMSAVQGKSFATYGSEQAAKTKDEIMGTQFEEQNRVASTVAADVKNQLESNSLLTTVKNSVKENILEYLVKGPVATIMDKITGLLERLGIGHLIKAYHLAKHAKKIHKQIEYYQEAAEIGTSKGAQVDLTLSAAADYAISKRKKALWESFFLAILRSFQGVFRILTLVVNPAGPITEIITFGASMLEKGIKVFHALKGVYKHMYRTKGKHRSIFAEAIIDQALNNNEKALMLIYNLMFRFSGQLSYVQKWLVKKILNIINETPAKDIEEKIDQLIKPTILQVIPEGTIANKFVEMVKEAIGELKEKKVKNLKGLDKLIGKKLVAGVSDIIETPKYQDIAEIIKQMFKNYPFLKSLLTADLMEQMKSTPVI